MDQKRWPQVKEILDAAIQRPPHERAAFLSAACSDDQALYREVESLLDSYESAFLEKPAVAEFVEISANAHPQVTEGQHISRYRIISLLAVSGMGEVYLAEDTSLGRKVALKLLPASFIQDEDRLHRFEQEARVASGFNHPNIVTIFEVGQMDSIHFIATEFIDGKTLRQRMVSETLGLRDALDIAIQVANALAAAHEAGIVHRDIKPENIMLRRDGCVRVLDFGLAKLTEQPALSSNPEVLTIATINTGSGLVGTVRYMSPEQARGQRVDARTDIFSLGVLLYEMITSRPPFAGATTSGLIASILQEEPLPLTSYVPDASTELQGIVGKTLRKEKEERYQTATDLLVDLRRLKQRLESEAEIGHRLEPHEKSGEVKAVATGSEQYGVATAVETSDAKFVESTSNAAYPLKKIKLRWPGAVIVLTAFVVMAAFFAYSRYWRQSGRANIDSAASIRSVAVLPFTNATGNPDMDYLSDGVSESLINGLSQLPGLKVIARSSSFKYKGKEVEPREVANTLGVDAILTGRVAQLGDNLLISVELVDARDRTQVWGEQYNRKATDLIAVQSEISSAIAQNLRLRLTTGERQQLAKRENVNPQAYELLLKGRFFWRMGGTDNRKKAIEFYEHAIAVDPEYALAYAELSVSYDGLVNNNLLDPKEGLPKAEEAARKALELDEGLAEGHLALAEIKLNAWDWAVAEREIKRAIELNPNLAQAHIKYAYYLKIQGQPQQAIAETKRARELDPLAPGANEAFVLGLLTARQNDQAIEAAKKMLELDHSNPDLHTLLGYTYAATGQYREAIVAYQEAIKLGDHSPDAQIYLGATYAKTGEREKARAILKRLEAGKEYVSPVGMAILHDAVGDREQAFALLERAYADHDQQLIWLGGRDFESFRSDPRFADLMRRIGL
jgi:serine/threonine-protein kinase